jgi:hypothetical protein
MGSGWIGLGWGRLGRGEAESGVDVGEAEFD